MELCLGGEQPAPAAGQGQGSLSVLQASLPLFPRSPPVTVPLPAPSRGMKDRALDGVRTRVHTHSATPQCGQVFSDLWSPCL